MQHSDCYNKSASLHGIIVKHSLIPDCPADKNDTRCYLTQVPTQWFKCIIHMYMNEPHRNTSFIMPMHLSTQFLSLAWVTLNRDSGVPGSGLSLRAKGMIIHGSKAYPESPAKEWKTSHDIILQQIMGGEQHIDRVVTTNLSDDSDGLRTAPAFSCERHCC